ncbi:glycerol-3-phosphate 1-O-acyltransferase PlsY [Acidithiobacillus caldus]
MAAPLWKSILLVLFAYLLGSIASAVLVARALRLPDPRQHGSGNPGATNILRLGGKRAAALTLVGDMLKGLVPVLAARGLGLDGWPLALVALAAFLGHLFPLYFGFRGGKGVATALGVLLAYVPLLGLSVLLTWIVVFAWRRVSSLAALVATLIAPLLAWAFALPLPAKSLVLTLAILVLWRHRSNLSRLLRGEESGFRPS